LLAQTDRPRPATLVTLAYLLLTLPVLFWRTRSGAGAAIAGAHVAAAICLWWSLRRAPRSWLADWLPLLLVPFLYAELAYLIGAGAVLHDPFVQAWEASLFGGQPARTLAGSVPNAAVSELLHLGYLLYYPIVYAPPLLLYVAGRRQEYERTVLAVMLTYALCYVAFLLFPVEGPRYAWSSPPDVPRGPVRWLVLAILERGSSHGTAFPSSHAAVAVAQTVAALRYQRPVGVVLLVASMLLMVGAVYGGFHYAVDIIVGAALGSICALVVLRGVRPARAREGPGSSGPTPPRTTIPDRG
jgi:membrane-associated phospholipid phosphatase